MRFASARPRPTAQDGWRRRTTVPTRMNSVSGSSLAIVKKSIDKCAETDAAQVNPSHGERDGRERDRTASAGRKGRPVETQGEHDAVRDAGLAGHARHPLHPADFESDESAEGRAGIEVRSAGPFEPAADFGEAERDEQRRDPDRHKRDRAPDSDLRGDLRRQDENGAADRSG